MDRDRYSFIGHARLDVANPVSGDELDRFVAALDLPPGSTVADFGCGKGEVLLRVIERYGARGVGIERSRRCAEAARARAAGRVDPAALDIAEDDARAYLARRGDAGGPPFDATLCLGSTHAFGGLAQTLRVLRGCTRAGGLIWVGEGYWKREPEPAYLAFLGAGRNDLASHAANIARGTALGFGLVRAACAREVDWDRYEGAYAEALEAFARNHPGDPDAAAAAERIGRWRDAYRRWGRATLGFGVYLFRTPAASS